MGKLKVRKDDKGMYSMTTRKGKRSTKSLLKRFGDTIFDPGKDRSKGKSRLK